MVPPPRPPSITRSIYLGTFAAIVVVATLSVVIYRSAVNDTVAQHSIQQLATVRTGAVGVQGEIQALSARLRTFASLPSVQNVDVPFLSQRVDAVFGDNPNAIMRYVVRVDADGKLYSWTPDGKLQDNGDQTQPDRSMWADLSNRANAGHPSMSHPWWMRDAPPNLRAVLIPIYRISPSAENPTPRNDFNGVLALVFDINKLVEVYLGPAVASMARDQLVVGLATPDFGVRIGSDNASVVSTQADPHNHKESEGTSMLDDAAGRRLHAWAKLDAVDEKWLVASSARYELVAQDVRASALGQLGITALLLLAAPIVGWLIARRERTVQEAQRSLERRLAESQKMEAIGKLAGGVAHDFNNMLTAILGYASMIQEDAAPKSAIHDQALQIRRAAENVAALTQKLLAFSRKQILQSDPVDFRSMLGNLMQLVRGAVGADITVSTQMGEDLWPILADPAQLEQSIINLAINARDAMPKGGTLQITARNAPRPTGERRPDADVKPGDYVQVTVTDTGTGMDEATRLRMFEPFYTTKAPGKGTGLGLSTVYGFVRQCGGYIGVLSTPGQGTSIELLLPRARAAATPTPTPLASSGLTTPPGTGTVLLAEDEEGVRQLAFETLQRNGFHVIAANSGEAALRLASAYDGTIHLLLTDVVMPGLKGPELAERMRALQPGIRVLLMSGFAADVVTPNDLRDAMLLSKPFAPAALLKAVRATLDVPLSSDPHFTGIISAPSAIGLQPSARRFLRRF